MYCPARQAGADGRAAEVHHPQALLALVDSPAVAADGLGVGGHLAAESHQHGVLQFGPPDLDHVGELFLFLLKRLHQGDRFAFQVVQGEDGRHAQGRGIGVVGRLVQVDVVVGIEALVIAQRPAEQLQGPVGQHLVDVHVGRSAGPALEGVDDDVLGRAVRRSSPGRPLRWRPTWASSHRPSS